MCLPRARRAAVPTCTAPPSARCRVDSGNAVSCRVRHTAFVQGVELADVGLGDVGQAKQLFGIGIALSSLCQFLLSQGMLPQLLGAFRRRDRLVLRLSPSPIEWELLVSASRPDVLILFLKSISVVSNKFSFTETVKPLPLTEGYWLKKRLMAFSLLS